MKVAVITPYHKEPLEMLKRAHDSVAAQTHPCIHYMVADGHARREIDEWEVRHIALPVEYRNNGNTPRSIGSLDAMGGGFDAIAYLDADNWFEPSHIERLLTLHKETGADMVSSGRVIHGIDGTVLLPEGEEGDGTETADTSTMLFTRPTFSVLPIWGTMPDELGPNCDRLIFKGAQALGCSHRHGPDLTVHFTSRYGPHYRAAGHEVPADATAMHAMKESDQFVRRLKAKGLSHVLSGRDVNSWFADKAREPLIVFIVGDENTLSPKQKIFRDELATALGSDAEIYFAMASEILDDKDFTNRHNNVFAVYFGDDTPERTIVDQVAEERGDIAVVYTRFEESSDGDVDTVLDRREWKVIVDTEAMHERFQSLCRYGNGHVLVADPSEGAHSISALMHAYAR